MKDYRKLIVWQKSLEMLQQTYFVTEKLPKSEEYGLKSQLRRASVSISSNIAEGSARKTEVDRKRFYTMARSSVIEVDTQFEIALRLKYFKEEDCGKVSGLMEEVFRMLSKMIS